MNILGTDISHWEDDPTTPKEIDFQMMKDAGANFVIFKVSQGVAWVDDVFRRSWADAKGILPRAAFYYQDNRFPGLDQAKFFLSLLRDDPPEGAYIVDFEDRTNLPTNPKTVNGHLWNGLTYLLNETNKFPTIYTSPDYWVNYGNTNSAWAQFPLHIANYRVLTPTIPAPWKKARMWQFTDRGEGGVYGVEAKGIDLDYFMGTEDEFKAEFGITTPPPAPLTIEQRVEKLEACAKSVGCIIEI